MILPRITNRDIIAKIITNIIAKIISFKKWDIQNVQWLGHNLKYYGSYIIKCHATMRNMVKEQRITSKK